MSLDRSQREFIGEASEIVENIQGGLSRIAEDHRRGHSAPGLLNEVFRHSHSLKGLAGMFGVEPMGRLAHQMETLLDGLRLGRLNIDDELMGVLYTCADTFAALLSSFSDGKPPDADAVDNLVNRITRKAGGAITPMMAGVPELLLSSESLSSLTEYEEHRLRDNMARGIPIYRVNAPLPLASFER